MKNESLECIKDALIDGDVEYIAKETSRSKTSVYHIFKKVYFNFNVLNLALDIIENRALEQLKRVKELRQELNQHNSLILAKKNKRKAA